LEFGWSLVAEYDADKIADDSDDERKIRKAAERKASMTKKKRSRSVQQSASLGHEVPFNRYHQSRRESEIVPVPVQSTPLPGRVVRQVSVAGAFFYCGEFGHFRRNCPKVPGGAAAASKQYPLVCDTYSDD